MKVAFLSSQRLSDSFDVTNGTKQGYVIPSVLFALVFLATLNHVFCVTDTNVKLQFYTSDSLFNHK